MMFMIAFEEIMEGFGCDLNTAIQLYQRGTVWEDEQKLTKNTLR